MRLIVRHASIYRYSGPVRENNNEVRLLPRTLPRQRILHESLRIVPDVPVFNSLDYWGNRVTHFSVLRPHTELRVESAVTVETLAPTDLSRPGNEPEVGPHALQDFLLPTRLTAPPPNWGDLGRAVQALRDGAGAPSAFLDGLSDLLRKTLRYEPGSTTVESSVAEVIAQGGGVCQDFSHLFVALCRWQSIPARYAGGYHYLGREAARHENHAWAEAYLPGFGWVGWDPANGCRVGEAHVQITAGRDFDDVSPVRGSFWGPRDSHLEVQLHMEEC